MNEVIQTVTTNKSLNEILDCIKSNPDLVLTESEKPTVKYNLQSNLGSVANKYFSAQLASVVLDFNNGTLNMKFSESLLNKSSSVFVYLFFAFMAIMAIFGFIQTSDFTFILVGVVLSIIFGVARFMRKYNLKEQLRICSSLAKDITNCIEST